MSYIIALAGKGGTGKTTIAALLARLIKEKGLGPVLAVDADPNSNLGEALGLTGQDTIGSIIDDIAARPESVPTGMTKDRFVEYRVQSAIVEGEGIDCLSMGKSEGPGCYCYANNCLRSVMEKLTGDYPYVIIDNEAGLEHLSRRTTRRADELVVVADDTSVAIKSAYRISALAHQLKIDIKKQHLLINRAESSSLRGGRRDCFAGQKSLRGTKCRSNLDLDRAGSQQAAQSQNRDCFAPTALAMTELGDKLKDPSLDYLGSLPYDEEVEKISRNGGCLMKLDNNAPVLGALRNLGEKICQYNRQ